MNILFRYGCDLCYTPMIISDSFVKSQKARDNEFTTNSGDNLHPTPPPLASLFPILYSFFKVIDL